MKVLVIYDSECRSQVETLRKEIADKFKGTTVLRMNSRDRNNKKIRIKHAWHRDAVKMIKLADMIVYAVSTHSAKNKNVNWEIKKALAYDKFIVCLRVDAGKKLDETDESLSELLSEQLFEIDKTTKEKHCLAEIVEDKAALYSIIDGFDKDTYIPLFNNNVGVGVDILLEQYKLFSESAEALVTRRQNVNSFYISANTALITIGATVFALNDNDNLLLKLIIVIVLSIPGIFLNLSWRGILKSYFINNKGKLKILSMIEKRLAASLYDAEWKAMKNRYSKERYISFTDREKRLPIIFIGIYGLFILTAIVLIVFIRLK